MEMVFKGILELSVICSYIIVSLVIIRYFLKKAPRVFSYGLWFILLIKIMVPINLVSTLGVMEKGKGLLSINGRDVIGKVIKLESYGDVGSVSNMSILGAIWLIGAITIFLYIVYSLFKIKKRLREVEFLRENIYTSNSIDTAFVFGIIKPKIYLPKNLSKEEEKYILAHERIHIKRLDYLVKLIWYIILSINWFNPLFWIAFKLMVKDMELSCDEKVIKTIGIEAKKDYSTILLELSSKANKSISPIGFGYEDIKERITNVLNYKKPKKIIIVISIVIIGITGIAFLTNKKESEKSSFTNKISVDKIEEDKNNDLEKKYKNPITLPDYKHKGTDEIENLVYDTAIKRKEKYYEGEFTIVAVQMNGVYKEEDKVKVFATIFTTGYVLEDKKLNLENGWSVPTAITYKDNKDGTYTVEKYEETSDGVYFSPSIEEYCTMPVSGKEIKGLHKKILNNYSDENLNKLERENLIKHLNENDEHNVLIGEYNDNLELEYNKIN